VVTTAFVGAGIVALGAAQSMHETKADPAAFSADAAAQRAQQADRANRAAAERDVTLAQTNFSDVWLPPLQNYTISTPFSVDATNLHPGVDLAAVGGTPYYATHTGTVKLARAYGGYGYAVLLDLGDGTTVLYGHASKLYVSEGQQVIAGEVLGLVGDSGYAFGDGLYLEVRVHGTAVDPKAFLLQRGLDITKGAQPSDD
jgi:murein DD-endopeptidase MepM/ murein hydrolase activator NlpD